jgi:hypothetical protein
MIYVKFHQSEHSEILAVCDEEVIGKTFTEENKEIKVSTEFYKGKLLTEADTVKILKECTNANLIGEKAIKCAFEAGIISKENIFSCGGIQHAQYYSLK